MSRPKKKRIEFRKSSVGLGMISMADMISGTVKKEMFKKNSEKMLNCTYRNKK